MWVCLNIANLAHKHMRYVVTGGAGFIGSHLVKLLLNHEHRVTIIDNLSHGKLENVSGLKRNVVFKEMDILNFEELKRNVDGHDGIFHQAALTSVSESFRNKEAYQMVNVNGSENIFQLASELKIKVVYASSASVYGHTKITPIKEDFDKNPTNPYGKTKLECETLATKYSKLGAAIIGLRYFNVYGRRNENLGVIANFFNAIQIDQPPTIFGNGSQMRDFVYVEDVAKANLQAMNSKTRFGFFNIGTGNVTSLNKLADLMIALSGKPLVPNHCDYRVGDVEKSQAGTNLAERLISWKYDTTLEDGLQKSLYGQP